MRNRNLFVFIAAGLILVVVGYFLWSTSRFGKSNSDITNRARNLTNLPLTTPEGMTMSIFAKGLGTPRVITFDKNGMMIVSLTASNKVVALEDKNNDGISEQQYDVAIGLNKPHGLAFLPSDSKKLYIAEENAVSVFDYNEIDFTAKNKKVLAELPAGKGHFTRNLMFLPGTDRLLISVGSSCNVCDETDPERAKILAMDSDGKNLKTYASGLRNSVYMTVRPGTNEVWSTDMGTDFLGDNIPPDEINLIEEGKDYGWPYCYGNNVPDTTFDKNANCQDKTGAKIELDAHSAPLGLAFVPSSWNNDWSGDLLVALHGSTNKNAPVGFKVIKIKLNSNKEAESKSDFINGWIQQDKVYGRPADIVIGPDDIAYITDDSTGVIYRLAVNK